jgi:starch synthase (maltosyl-transferring)
LMEHVARRGAEEYVDNEKYQLRQWDLQRSNSLAPLMRLLNQLRRENPPLQDNRGLHIHPTDNDFVLAFSKRSDDAVILVVINLDTAHSHSAWIDVNGEALGVKPDESFQVHDLLGDARYRWRPGRNFVQLDPHVMPAHIFRIRRHVRSEHDFEYFV